MGRKKVKQGTMFGQTCTFTEKRPVNTGARTVRLSGKERRDWRECPGQLERAPRVKDQKAKEGNGGAGPPRELIYKKSNRGGKEGKNHATSIWDIRRPSGVVSYAVGPEGDGGKAKTSPDEGKESSWETRELAREGKRAVGKGIAKCRQDEETRDGGELASTPGGQSPTSCGNQNGKKILRKGTGSKPRTIG